MKIFAERKKRQDCWDAQEEFLSVSILYRVIRSLNQRCKKDFGRAVGFVRLGSVGLESNGEQNRSDG